MTFYSVPCCHQNNYRFATKLHRKVSYMLTFGDTAIHISWITSQCHGSHIQMIDPLFWSGFTRNTVTIWHFYYVSKQNSPIEITWWRHQRQTFFTLLALCTGNSPVTVEFPSQRPVTWSFDVFFGVRLNKQLNKQSRRRWFDALSRSLWRHCYVKVDHKLTFQAMLTSTYLSCAPGCSELAHLVIVVM